MTNLLEKLEEGEISNGEIFIDSWESLTSVVIIVYPPETPSSALRKFGCHSDSCVN